MAYSPYKMKGHTLPGIKQVKSNKTKDGRAGSSALQKKDSRSIYQKAKDEGKQLAAGAKAAGRVLADRDYFKPVKAVKDAVKAYKKEESKQAKERSGGKSSPTKKNKQKSKN